MINDNVKKYTEQLDNLGISYKIVEHPEIKTVDEILSYFGLNYDDGTSTLIMKADNRLIVLLRRDDCKLDFKKVKQIVKVNRLRLATKEEFVELTGLEPGAARPYLPGIETYIDKKVLEKEIVQAGSGSFTCSIRYKTKDLIKIPGSKIVDIVENLNPTNIKRVFAGCRPTGRLHIGNYLGSVKGMIELANNPSYDSIFSVVDLHGITTPYDPKTMQQQIREVVLDYLGAGLDPKKCHLMIQSQVPEHIELSYLIGTIYPVSRLEDLPTYKDKKLENPGYNNMGLLYYPVLMAADIMLYKAELIPVGKDQLPHIEVTREIARGFNRMFGNTFPEPKEHTTRGTYVPSIRGEGKMSKAVEGSYINLTDSPEMVKQRLAGAPTDGGKGEKVPTTGGVANLLELAELFEGKEEREELEERYVQEGIRYGELKANLAEAIYKELKPIQERRNEYENNPKLVDQILEEGREYCSKIAKETMREVKEKMGLV